MPRQDVPYGGAICRLRERIAEIWDELGKKLHSINGVEGDGQGNVLIRSDNAALTITDDQVQHEIVLDLDTSQLPAADVNSVNGQTGVVALTADDIPSDNGDVQTDLDNLAAADTTLQGNINAEALARQNADSTLQTNINSALATIPGEVSSQIASNAAIIQLQSDVLAIPNKVDKRTGTGKFAYTHDGATQGDIALIDGTTAATIPIRDANGRMQAADPASGATDKTLVTANWVSQTGDSSPNNLVHRSGNETINGTKTFEELTPVMSRSTKFQRVTASNNWYKVFNITSTGRHVIIMDVIWAHQSYNGYGAGRVAMAAIGGNTVAKWLYKQGNASAFSDDSVFIGISATGIDIWVKGGYYVYSEIVRSIRGNVEPPTSEIVNVYDGTGYASIDTSAYVNYAYSSV